MTTLVDHSDFNHFIFHYNIYLSSLFHFIFLKPSCRAKGVYYLRTRSKSPFALGRRGSQCSKIIHNHLEKSNSENTEVINTPDHSQMISNIKQNMVSLTKLPKHKFKDDINMHLINGIRKLEDLHTPEVYEQLNP